MLDLPLVVPVVDVARVVVVVWLVHRIDLGKVHANRGDMVGDYIDHDPDSHRVSRIDQLLQGINCTKVRVDHFPVSEPVSVVSIVQVVDHR